VEPKIEIKAEAVGDDELTAGGGKEVKVKSAKKHKSTHKQPAAKTFTTHNVFTHFPKCEDCDICAKSKPKHTSCKKSDGSVEPDSLPEPKKFADSITADWKILNKENESRTFDMLALVVQDRFTHWLQSYPSGSRDAEATQKWFQRFWGPQVKPEYVYSDGAGEFAKALDLMGICKDVSTPHRPSTNGVAERAVQRVKGGTSAALLQSGWHDCWWAEAMMCYCFLRNVVDTTANGNTAYKTRYGSDFAGPIIPFGCRVDYMPSNPSDIARLAVFGTQFLAGIFMGYVQRAGGGWSGDLWICDKKMSLKQVPSMILV